MNRELRRELRVEKSKTVDKGRLVIVAQVGHLTLEEQKLYHKVKYIDSLRVVNRV